MNEELKGFEAKKQNTTLINFGEALAGEKPPEALAFSLEFFLLPFLFQDKKEEATSDGSQRRR